MSDTITKPTFTLELGALSPSISEQLYTQGFRLKSGVEPVLLQKDADALTRCNIRSLIPDSAVKAGRQRLTNRIAKALVRLTATPPNEGPKP